MKSLLGVLVASFALALTPASAFAVDRLVEEAPTGVDAGDCSVSPCATIAYATGQAVSGDRVLIGNGTFVQTDAIRPVDKSVEYIGNGPANTVLTANGANSFLQAGMFRFQWNNRDYAVKNMTIQGLPSTNAGSALRYAVYAQPTHPTPAPTPSTYGLDLVFDNVQVIGNTGSPAKTEIAVYTAVSTGTASVTNSTITNVMGNSLLFEQQQGALTVSGNTIVKPLSSSGAVVAVMAHADASNANPYNITGAQIFFIMMLRARAGVMVLAGWPYTTGFGPSALLGGLTISGNSIDKTTSSASAIDVLNTTNANDGTPGRIVAPQITSNTVTAQGSGTGLRLQGYIPNAVVTQNNLRGNATGILLNRHTRSAAPNPGTFDHVPTGTKINANQIVDNASGVTTDPGTSIAADLNGNWWGCNAGPEVASSPAGGDCDTVTTAAPGVLALTRWAQLSIFSGSPTLAAGGSAQVFTGFPFDNLGGGTQQIFPNGTTLPLTPAGGSLANANPGLTANNASTTFTSAGGTGRSVSASLDHQSVSWAWPDLDTTPPVVTITSPANGAVISSAPTELTFTTSEPATCTPPNGSTLPLAIGSNTFTVTCTDAAGNVGTASVTVIRPDALPQCARNLMITDVTRVGSRTRIRGIARTQFAGQNISFEYQPTGTKVIGKAKVSSTGAFQIVVKRPSKPVWTSNSARYRAVLGTTKTSWVKLSRRMGATAVTYDGNGGLKVTGSASLPIAKGQPVRVMRSDACGAWRQIGTLRMNSDGTFSGTVASGGGSEAAVNIRIQARVAKASNPRYSFNTYSIVQPVIVER